MHRLPRVLKNLKLPGATTDRRGRLKLTMEAGETLDLGEI